MSTGPPGSRPQRLSASTPPPSPPLAALAVAKTMQPLHRSTDPPSSLQEHHRDLEQDHRRHSSEPSEPASKSTNDDKGSTQTLKGLQPPSPPLGDAGPTATAAAAAAAASYTMQELAIAYSMVTSTRQQQQQEQQRRQENQQKKSDSDEGKDKEAEEESRSTHEAKLDQPHHADGSDALSSLWKKTTPLQEPYFQTRHTIASQHTLSTLGGVLFSLDEVPLEFNQDMYIAMRNRIFELEAKSVNYSPFSHSRKRSMDRAGIEETVDRFGGYDRRYEPGHYAKRPMHSYRMDPRGPPVRSSAPSDDEHFPGPPRHHHPGLSSYPSWYTPEVYTGGSRAAYALDRYPVDREFDYPSIDPRTGHELQHPSSHPGSPHSNYPPMRSARSPPPQAGHPHPHSRQQGPGATEERYAMDERLHVPPSAADSAHSSNSHHPHPLAHRPSNQGAPARGGPMHPGQHPQKQPSGAPSQTYPHPSQGHAHPHPQSQPQPGPQSIAPRPLLPNGNSSAALTEQQQRQSIHQQRHRAQQQAQSAHSRSYHLHKHMRMLDQQRAAQLAAKQQHFQQQQHEQQQQHQQQQHIQKQQQLQLKQHPQNGTHGFRAIQRHYQPHQQMYPVHQQPIPIKPHPGPQQAQTLRPGQQPQGQLSQQQLMMQRYQQHRQLQQKQLQLRQLQYLRNKSSAQYPTQANSSPSALAAAAAASSTPGSHSPTPPRVFGSQVDQPIKKSTRPLECANCMSLDSLSWKPKSDSTGKATDHEPTVEERSTILCPACTQYLQTHGKPRPVPPFRTNFLKKIHTRFKRELQEVRFQGWQDAQVLEIEDRMDEREFQMVFNGLDEADAAVLQRPAASTTTAAAADASSLPATSPPSSSSPKAAGSPHPASDKASDTTLTAPGPAKVSIPEDLVIKIEDDDDDGVLPKSDPKNDDLDIRTYQSEASVGELFGHRWRTEPVVGYTLVHFGGSDRTRMVPMNPTVPSLTVTFNRTAESITFAFRVLVNGLCLLSTGGGPPALHMPETVDDEDEEEEEEEVVVIPDNDKEGASASPVPDTKTPDQPDSVKQTKSSLPESSGAE
ncbi:hypothetical protein EMPS_09808 [Entomortierella parvispora]|uniref:Uncharacterized protein n=1 Tax=Entomortierella parvispora TaxID=205924 RepID=A0A9P3HIP0_9FUNG|nr:hypothetical protein EMPS_09808 [Entomortierella parvispora]